MEINTLLYVIAHAPYSDQIRENVLSKQYYCDIDIAHLIAFNENLAHRLNNEPAEIIPIASTFDRALQMAMLTKTTVRSSPQDLHSKDPVPLPKRRRPQSRQSPPRTPTPHPFLRLTHFNSWSDRDKRVTSRPHSGHCHRRQHPQLKSHKAAHPMPKLRTYRRSRGQFWVYWHHTASHM